MKYSLFTLLFMSFSLFSKASIETTKKIDLNINLQKMNLASEDFRIVLSDKTTATIRKEKNGTSKSVTAKIIKTSKDLKLIEFVIKENGIIIDTPQISVKRNSESLYQTFDSNGNSDLKVLVKLN